MWNGNMLGTGNVYESHETAEPIPRYVTLESYAFEPKGRARSDIPWWDSRDVTPDVGDARCRFT
jgi:hypothetical protein